MKAIDKTGSATTTCWQVQSEVMMYAWQSHRRYVVRDGRTGTDIGSARGQGPGTQAEPGDGSKTHAM